MLLLGSMGLSADEQNALDVIEKEYLNEVLKKALVQSKIFEREKRLKILFGYRVVPKILNAHNFCFIISKWMKFSKANTSWLYLSNQITKSSYHI